MTRQTIIKYLTEEKYCNKLISTMENHGEELLKGRVEIRETIYQLQKNNNQRLYRKKEHIYLGMAGSPICIAAYAGNLPVVDYLLKRGALEVVTDDYKDGTGETFGWSEYGSSSAGEIGNVFYCTRMELTKGEYSYHSDKLYQLDPISFTYPEGKLECLRLFLEAGATCDFHRRGNLQMLALCRERNVWEYLLDNGLLEPCILIIAAEYASHFRNYKIVEWLYGCAELHL